MFRQRKDPAKLVAGYGILGQAVYPWKGVVEPPFGAGWAVVQPGKRTKHHNHQECETFFIVSGRGRMRVGDDLADVEAGDVVFQPPFNPHTLENTSPTEDLVFLSVYWEDFQLWNARQAAALSQGERPQRVLVATAPATPQGDLHLGHLAGPYLAGDVLTRYLRLRGVEAHHACGTDDHASAPALRGVSGAQAAARFAAAIAGTLAAADVAADLFLRPAAPGYRELAQGFFRRLLAGGKLAAREEPHPFCPRCELYLHGSHLAGRCRRCGAGGAGSGCEECGWPSEGDLVAAVCAHCGGRPVERPVARPFFPLSRYATALKEHYLKAGMNAHQRAHLEEVLAGGLPDLPVTQVAAPLCDRGIPAPGYAGQVLSAWFEAAPRWLAAAQASAGEGSGGWERFWKEPAAEVVACFGADDLFLHGLFVPALLLAFDPQIRLPAAYVMNEPYRLGERRFSAARREEVPARELLAEVPADLLRFYLAWTRPETEGTSFSRAELAELVERELVGAWQPWLAELGAKLAAERGGAIPWTGDWTEDHRRFYARLQELIAEAASGYEPRGFSPRQAMRACGELVRAARRFGKAEAHWRRVASRSEERRTGLALELLAAKALAQMAAPVMPRFAARLWHDLGYDTPLAEARWEDRPAWVPGNQTLRGLGGPYFAPVGGLAGLEPAHLGR